MDNFIQYISFGYIMQLVGSLFPDQVWRLGLNSESAEAARECPQNSVVTYKKKESEKESVYIYISESLCCIPETKTL